MNGYNADDVRRAVDSTNARIKELERVLDERIEFQAELCRRLVTSVLESGGKMRFMQVVQGGDVIVSLPAASLASLDLAVMCREAEENTIASVRRMISDLLGKVDRLEFYLEKIGEWQGMDHEQLVGDLVGRVFGWDLV